MGLLSVSIPCWRVPEKFLRAAIDSIYAQEGFPEPIKVGVVLARDDPSVGWIAKAYPAVDIYWVKKHHVGEQHDMALRGDGKSVFTAYLDADDVWLPNRAASILNAQDDEVALWCDFWLCDADMKRKKLRRTPSKVTVATIWNNGKGNLMPDAGLFRRSAVERLGGLRLGKFEWKYHWWDFWIRLAQTYPPGCFRKSEANWAYREWRGQIHVAEFQQQPMKGIVAKEKGRFLRHWKRRLA